MFEAEGYDKPVDVEAGLIGIIFNHPDAYLDAATQVKAEHFYHGQLRAMWEVMTACHEEHGTIDLSLLKSTKVGADRWAKSGGAITIGACADKAGTISSLNAYCSTIRDRHGVRKIGTAIQGCLRGLGDNLSFNEAMAFVEGELASLRGILPNPGLFDASALGDAFEDWVSPTSDSRILTHIPDLNEALDGGLGRGWLALIMGIAKMGKTSLAISLARQAAMDGRKVVFYSYEMSGHEVWLRVFSQVSPVSLREIRKQGNSLAVQEASKYLPDAMLENLEVQEGRGWTVEQLRTDIAKRAHTKGCDMVVVDYLQLLPFSDSSGLEASQLGHISGTLKAIAQEYNLCMIGLVQPGLEATRAVRSGMIPRLNPSHAKGTSRFGQDCDLWLLPHRDVQDTTGPFTEAQIHIDDFRHGLPGTIHCEWVKDRMIYR